MARSPKTDSDRPASRRIGVLGQLWPFLAPYRLWIAAAFVALLYPGTQTPTGNLLSFDTMVAQQAADDLPPESTAATKVFGLFGSTSMIETSMPEHSHSHCTAPNP